MKKNISIIVWMGLCLGIASTAYATDVRQVYGAEYKYGTKHVTNEVTTQEKIGEALVEPYLQKVEIRKESDGAQTIKPSLLKVWIIADDHKGYKIYFNQNTREFGLARYSQQGETPFVSDSSYIPTELTKVFLARK